MVIVHRKYSKYSNKQVIFYSSVGKPTAPLITRSTLFILLIFNNIATKKKLECSALGKRSALPISMIINIIATNSNLVLRCFNSYFTQPNILANSQITIPAVTETLSECLVPNCGISIEPSQASTTCCCTPLTSLPRITA